MDRRQKLMRGDVDGVSAPNTVRRAQSPSGELKASDLHTFRNLFRYMNKYMRTVSILLESGKLLA
jgi:hypothetical protein